MKYLYLSLALLLACATGTAAQARQTVNQSPALTVHQNPPSPAAIADAEAIIRITGTEELILAQLREVLPVVASSFLGELSKLPDGARYLTQIDARYPGGRTGFSHRFGELYGEKMESRWPEIRAELVKVYTSRLSADDLKAVRSFYESGPGRGVLAAQPQLNDSFIALGRRFGEDAGEYAARELAAQIQRDLGIKAP